MISLFFPRHADMEMIRHLVEFSIRMSDTPLHTYITYTHTPFRSKCALQPNCRVHWKDLSYIKTVDIEPLFLFSFIILSFEKYFATNHTAVESGCEWTFFPCSYSRKWTVVNYGNSCVMSDQIGAWLGTKADSALLSNYMYRDWSIRSVPHNAQLRVCCM